MATTSGKSITPGLSNGSQMASTAPVLQWLAGLVVLAVALYVAPDVTASALIVFGLGLPLFLLVLWRPELGILALVFLSSSFIRPDTIDLRLPVGGLDLRDLALLGLLGLLVMKGLLRRRLAVPWWPVGGPLLLFLGISTFSALYAMVYKGVESTWVMGELRPLMYYTAMFVAAWGITRRAQVITLLAGLYLLADLTATVVLLQQSLGRDNPLLAAMAGQGAGWRLWRAGEGAVGFGAVRIVPPGHVLMFAMSIVAFCLMLFTRQPLRWRIVFVLQFVYLNVGLLFTYTRAQWIASALALALVVVFLSRDDKAQLLRYALVLMVALLLAGGLFTGPFQQALGQLPFLEPLGQRALSIFTPDETLDTDSLEWRLYESEEAFRSISHQPLLGTGLGNAYRDVTLLNGEAQSGNSRFTRFVHNSYLYLAVKLGLPGLLAFLWFGLSFLGNGWRSYRVVDDEQLKRVILALLASFVGLLAWAVWHAHLFQVESTVVIGLMAGLVAGVGQSSIVGSGTVDRTSREPATTVASIDCSCWRCRMR